MEFPLSRAPELLFDPQLWDLFVSYFDAPETALKRIGYRPDLAGYHSELYPIRSQLSQAQWREIEEAYQLGQEILRSLQTKFLTEELKATGVPGGRWRPEREPIPASEWLRLWPNFVENRAMSTVSSYDDIQVIWRPPDPKAELLLQCVRMLMKRKESGESRRKILLEEANKYFGRVTIRLFNEAYGTVFQKKRGRPPRTK
jgi:hypothetical protein